MAAKTRIYRIVDKEEGDAKKRIRLVKATNPAQALKHVTTPRFTTLVAEMDDVVSLVKSGIEVEIAATE